MCFAVVVVSSFAFRFASTSLACAESLRRDRRGAAPAAHLAVGLRSTSTCRRPRADDPPRNALPSSRSSPPANQQLPDRRPRGGPSALLRGEARSVSAPRFVREFVPGGFFRPTRRANRAPLGHRSCGSSRISGARGPLRTRLGVRFWRTGCAKSARSVASPVVGRRGARGSSRVRDGLRPSCAARTLRARRAWWTRGGA